MRLETQDIRHEENAASVEGTRRVAPMVLSLGSSEPYATNPARNGKARLLGKAVIFLMGIQILSSILYPQEARTQQNTELDTGWRDSPQIYADFVTRINADKNKNEIRNQRRSALKSAYPKDQRAIASSIQNMEQQLKGIETNLMSINEELESLNERFNTVTNKVNKLKQELREEEAKPKGFLSRIASIFGYRKRGKLEKLLTESQDLADKIRDGQKRRGPLVNEFVALADELVEKSSLRITTLMEVVREAGLNNDIAVRDEALKQVSSLWQLAERTTAARNKYAPGTFGPERTINFSSLLSNDTEELRLGAAILKDWAAAARADAAQLERQIEKLQSRKSLLEQMMELSKQIQRSDEERGAVGVGATGIPWGSDMAIKREIDDIEEKVGKLSVKKRKYEADSELFESQSKILEQRASQMDAELKGKSEDD